MDEFFGAINNFFLAIGGVLFDWMLVLGQSWALLLIALVTSAILTFVRPWTTRQELLRRCEADKKVLKRRLKEAKRRRAAAVDAGDRDAFQAAKDQINSIRMVVGKVGMKQAGAEGKPLLVAILPVVLVFVWAADRLAYVPPEEGERITVHAYFPDSAADRLAYIIPQDGLTEANGNWVKRIWLQKVPAGQPANGQADWVLKAKARPAEPYVLKINYDGRLYEKELLVGAGRNSPVLEMYGEEGLQIVELGLDELKPFGFLPNIPIIPPLGWYIPAWLFLYLLVTIPFVFVLKGLFKIL